MSAPGPHVRKPRWQWVPAAALAGCVALAVCALMAIGGGEPREAPGPSAEYGGEYTIEGFLADSGDGDADVDAATFLEYLDERAAQVLGGVSGATEGDLPDGGRDAGNVAGEGARAEGTHPGEAGSEGVESGGDGDGGEGTEGKAPGGESFGFGGDASAAADITVAWTEERGLVELAGEVLRAYRDVPTAVLATSGYLDLKGNAWGAVVRDARGWVDVLTVSAAEGDAQSAAHVVRMVPGDAIE